VPTFRKPTTQQLKTVSLRFSQHNSFKLLCCGFSGRWHFWATVCRDVSPHDAMLARRYMLSSRISVCPSAVRLSQAGIVSKHLGRIEMVFGMDSSFHLPLYAYKEIRVLPEMGVFPSGTLSQTLDFENVATKSRSCRQRNSSTVELVGHICDGLVYASWLFTTRPSTVTLYFYLLWICYTACVSVDKINFRLD